MQECSTEAVVSTWPRPLAERNWYWDCGACFLSVSFYQFDLIFYSHFSATSITNNYVATMRSLE